MVLRQGGKTHETSANLSEPDEFLEILAALQLPAMAGSPRHAHQRWALGL